MDLQVISRSKYRSPGKDGDDVALAIPNCIYAVFDGATDPFGTMIDGESVGRIAARTVAAEFKRIAQDADAKMASAESIIQRVSDTLRNRTERLNLANRASTTLAVVFDLPSAFRVLLLGDTGVRINGNRTVARDKKVDHVTTNARVNLFRLLSARSPNKDDVEYQTRKIMNLGLEHAIEQNCLSSAEADALVTEAADRAGLQQKLNVVDCFLQQGIQGQQTFANKAGHPLGFASMNGQPPIMTDVEEIILEKSAVSTIEIFSDGYISLPEKTGVVEWEREFERVENDDFHKIGSFQSVKGSTGAEYFDDRTVICLAN